MTCDVAEEVAGKCVPTGLPNWVSRETEDLRKARDVAKREHLTLKTSFSRLKVM